MATQPSIRSPAPVAQYDSLEPAGLVRRLAALVYDALLLAALLFVLTFALIAVRGGRAIPPGTVWYDATLAVVVAIFFCSFWIHGGQTAGMRAWHIKLVAATGGPVPLRAALVRFGAAFAAALPLGLGLLASLWDPQRRCWHDRCSHTRVVRLRRVTSRERAP